MPALERAAQALCQGSGLGPALPALGAQRGGAAGLGLKLFHPAATEHAGSAIQGIPSFIWGLPLALPRKRGSSLGEAPAEGGKAVGYSMPRMLYVPR